MALVHMSDDHLIFQISASKSLSGMRCVSHRLCIRINRTGSVPCGALALLSGVDYPEPFGS
jgi:hypothetical protein